LFGVATLTATRDLHTPPRRRLPNDTRARGRAAAMLKFLSADLAPIIIQLASGVLGVRAAPGAAAGSAH
jgi:hypothetical protein